MISRVIIRREAKHDIREATRWYRDISRTLASDFVRRVDDAVNLVRERPLAFPVVYRTFRRILLNRFPYALFYDSNERRIAVIAVLHQARDQRILDHR